MQNSASPVLSGELTFATVSGFLDRSAELLVGGMLDLSAVSRADSAGLALLLELTRRARANGATLNLRGANRDILRLAHFFGLDEVLNFEAAPSEAVDVST